MIPFQSIAIPLRTTKPRKLGLTMVLDKYLGTREASDLMEVNGQFIDILKLGWGTSRVYPPKVLAEKIDIYKSHEILVCPGGTLFELAFLQKKIDSFLQEAKFLGFNCVEISDGTIVIDKQKKLDMIKKARDFGFSVISEVGHKFELRDREYPIEQRIEDVHLELGAGSFKVVIEARESGSFGIFNKEHEVVRDIVENFTNNINMEDIIFEAPLPSQQEWLIRNLGNMVNIGNVAPRDCMTLETYRCGLNASTLEEFHINNPSVFIENGVAGALAAVSRNNVIIVIDALRATATIVTALANGARHVVAVSSVEECKGEVTAGERGGSKIPGLDYDNSPRAFVTGCCSGRELVLTTTNGTECINASLGSKAKVLIGAMANARAVAKKAFACAQEEKTDISIVMAGRNNLLAREDLVTASKIISYLGECTVKGYIQPLAVQDIAREFIESDSGKNLISLGKKEDVLFCAQENLYDIVPICANRKIVTA
ncbi:MAG: phosphosulfolactate synthase [Deltaproteobacteria bacterium]|nr:phosphosulfolactate synthase [Deltaproteobacteria bacterium]